LRPGLSAIHPSTAPQLTLTRHINHASHLPLTPNRPTQKILEDLGSGEDLGA